MEEVEVLQAACCIAGADGQISECERELISKLGRGCGVGRASLTAMIERARTDSSFCEEQFQILKTDPQETMAILLEIASADGGIGDTEMSILQSFSRRLNVPDRIFTALLAKVRALTDRDSKA
jgi:tellurite resistance protein